MKYLKEYNQHNNSYSEIDSNEWDENISPFSEIDNTIEFTDKDFKIVCNIFKYTLLSPDNKIIYFDIQNRAYNRNIFIVKHNDEWYYVRLTSSINEFYKCDQMSGLIDCLTMLKNKYNL
jgi:hypothetical protein